MKKFACLLMAVMLCPSAALADFSENLFVTLVNKTDAKVFVALGEMSTGGEDDGDFSKGWWGVDPGKTRTIKLDYSPVCEYGFYATSQDGKRVWAGRAKDENILGTFWIHPTKRFFTHPDNPIKGGKKVDFRHIGVGTDGKVTITFTAK